MRNQGYTIIELMLAVLIMGLLSMAVAAGFEGQKAVFNSNERTVEAQEDARLVLDLIKFDTRMAGFMVSPIAAIASGDGGVNDPDRLCVSESAGFDLPVAAEPTSLNDRIEKYDNPNVIAIVGNSVITLTSLDLDADDDGSPNEIHFAENAGIIISDGTRSHCAAIDVGGINTLTSTITMNPNHPIVNGAFNPASVRAVPAVIYEIPDGTTTLTRNGTTMSTTVEDLQVEYWSLTTALANPVHDMNDVFNPLNPATVSRVRLSVVARSTQADVGSTKKFGGGQRPPVANRVAGAADNVQRRIFTANVRPRNISSLP